MYGKEGPEYDFVVNVRTEQGGVRVWVYRLMCPMSAPTEPVEQKQVSQQNSAPAQQQQQSPHSKNESFEKRRQYLLKLIAENQDAPSETVQESVAAAAPSETEQEVVNPLQYRPPQQRQKDAPETRLL
uniref:Uncharacterized protein n=1 Tax=Ditylenchus dipsaci TaxID=166011 RepID=A0A915EIQ8_9BILA